MNELERADKINYPMMTVHGESLSMRCFRTLPHVERVSAAILQIHLPKWLEEGARKLICCCLRKWGLGAEMVEAWLRLRPRQKPEKR